MPGTLTAQPVHLPTASRAAKKQMSAMALINSLKKSHSDSSIPSSTISTPEQLQSHLADDRKIAETAFAKYCGDGVLSDPEALEDFDIVRWWEVREPTFFLHRFCLLALTKLWQHDHKLVFHIALDVMAAQASAVPCKRAFSSAKETDALH